MFLTDEGLTFQDRAEAGRRLAEKLRAYHNRKDVIVLGIPRGGVSVAFEIAKALHAPLDIFVSRKLGVPWQEELAFGAIASGGVRVLDPQIVEAAGISNEQIEEVTRQTKKELERREKAYRGDQAPLAVEGRTVILVDDGIATGSSMLAAINALQQLKPARLVVAAPVAPQSTYNRLRRCVDDFVCVHTPKHFYAIGQFYMDFSQITDEEVTELLRLAAQPAPEEVPDKDTGVFHGGANMNPDPTAVFNGDKCEVAIDVEGATLEGALIIPRDAKGLVLFAHGSGSSRLSPRNQYVAHALQSKGVGTLLFDLLTRKEESIDQYTAELRFNIPFLAKRLAAVTEWVLESPDTQNLKLGYFGASTGAAAALVAAAELPDDICAVVSRGGRPDLAGDSLRSVQAPTLLIVGGEDEPVIGMNREALAKLPSKDKQLVIIPGATHLFEEPGTLEEVARLAGEWFTSRFSQVSRRRGRELQYAARRSVG